MNKAKTLKSLIYKSLFLTFDFKNRKQFSFLLTFRKRNSKLQKFIHERGSNENIE